MSRGPAATFFTLLWTGPVGGKDTRRALLAYLEGGGRLPAASLTGTFNEDSAFDPQRKQWQRDA